MLVGTGVFVDVGAGVFVTRTLNVPLFTLEGMGVADGSDATTLPMVRAELPPLAPGKTLK